MYTTSDLIIYYRIALDIHRGEKRNSMKHESPLPFVYVGMYQAVSTSSATWEFLDENEYAT
jgi:hypothetical protein